MPNGYFVFAGAAGGNVLQLVYFVYQRLYLRGISVHHIFTV